MNSTKKILISLVFIFVVGLGTGYFYGSKKQASPKGNSNVVLQNTENEGGKTISAEQKDKLLQKIDLLKSYTDLIMLPSGKISDPKKIADDMGAKVQSINDNELTTKFYATGETVNKEQKIIDFLDYLNNSIKADLQ